jgi:hypothetical protein
MFISRSASAFSGFLRWSRTRAKNNSNDNDQPGGSMPLSLAHPLSGDPDASEGRKRARTI